MTVESKFCPKYGSSKMQWASGLPQLWSIWECKQCGYRGAFVVEDGALETKIKEKYIAQLNDKDK